MMDDGGKLPLMAQQSPDDEINDALRIAKEPVRYDTGPQPGEPVLSSYDPTIKERIYQGLAGTEARPSPERAGFARGMSQMAEFAPILGNVMAGQEAYRRGDTKGMLMAAVPLPGAAKEGAAVREIEKEIAPLIKKSVEPKRMEYQGAHQSPGPESGAPLWRMHGIYPDDLYSPQGFRYHADFGNPYDMEGYQHAISALNQPSKSVIIYRAVPKDKNIKEINAGDWVTLTKDYAKEHGESRLGGNYKILKKSVKARDLFTSGDSIHEFGYHPQPYVSDSELVSKMSPEEARLKLSKLTEKARNSLRSALEERSRQERATGGKASGTMNDDIIQDALRIADSRLGRADGGEIPTPPRRPDDLEHYAVMADAQKKFPFINKYDPHIKVEPREGDQNFSEFYNAKETGDPKNPSDARPEEFPYGSSGVRVYKPEKFTAADYAAEYLHGDPVANKTREELISRLTPEQLKLIKGQPDYQESVRLGLPEERALNNVVDAMMRGYVMQDEPSNQWPKQALAELEFTPEELELLNSLQDYVEAPAQSAPAPEAAPAEEMPERKLGGKINTIIDRDPDWRMGLDDGGLVDAHTGLPPKEDWTELISRQEYGRRLEQGVPLREMAAHERYLEENPHKLRSLSEHIIRMLPTGQYNVPMAYPDRAPPLKRFAHGGEVSDALRVVRSRLAYGGLPDSYMDDDRYKVFQQMGGTRTDPRSEAIGRFLPRMTYHESRDRPLAGAKTSSAAGLAQFTRPTWRKITEGEPEVAGKSREELYAMRRDPSEEGQRFHMRMAEKLANKNADMLEKAGLPVTPENLYAAHFGGPHGVRAAAAPAGTRLKNIFSPAEINANSFLKGQTAGGFRKFADRAISETPRGLPMDLEFKRSQLPANRYEGLQTAMAGAQQQPWQVAAAPQQTPSTQMAYAKPEQRGFSPDLMTPRPAPQPTQMARLPDMNVGGQRAMAADRGPMEGPGPKMAQDRGPMVGGSGPGVPETQMAMAQPMQQQAPEIEQASYQPEPERPNQDMLEGLEQPFVGWPDFASLFADGGVVGDALRLATGGRTPAWTRAEGKSKTGGLNAKGRASYNRANPGKPGLKPPAPHPKTEKDANRRKSFCARMKGMRRENTSAETARDPDSRINKSLRAWNCADGGQVWDKPRPKHLGEPDPLSAKQKKSAKAAAKSAGRPYPNFVDNIRAAQKRK